MTTPTTSPAAGLPEWPQTFDFEIDEGEGDVELQFVKATAYNDLRAIAQSLTEQLRDSQADAGKLLGALNALITEVRYINDTAAQVAIRNAAAALAKGSQ